MLVKLGVVVPVLLSALVFCTLAVQAKKMKFMSYFNRSQTRVNSRLNLNGAKETDMEGKRQLERVNDGRFHSQASCQNKNAVSIFENYLKLNRRSALRTKLIREFLSLKYLQYHDLITSIMSSSSQQELYDLESNSFFQRV